jgi:DNA (cytosine-5)-methyltransferase 1
LFDSIKSDKKLFHDIYNYKTENIKPETIILEQYNMIRIGTDCSGIDAPIQALQQLKIPFEHKWACEKDQYARQSIKANYNPEMMFEDILSRDHKTLPDIDLYVCGFPCQPFSSIGLQKGMKDKRSNIMLECIDVIKRKTPKVFILENVKNFKVIQKGAAFKRLIRDLNSIKINKLPGYTVQAKVLNTRDYGLPQNRERVYIVGIRNDALLENFEYPTSKKMKPIDQILQKNMKDKRTIVSTSMQKNLDKIGNKPGYIVTPFTFYSAMKDVCPALTTNCGQLYSTTMKRYLSTNECLKLQGFNTRTFKQVVSETQMFKQAGNSMSVNVLKELIRKILKCVDF